MTEDWFEEHDIHIHVPAGAVPKDGPVGGRDDGDGDRVARPRRPIADGRRDDGRDHAHRAGAADRRDPREVARRAAGRAQARDPARATTSATSSELPPETREGLEFIPTDTIEDVFAAAFDGTRPARSAP